jgi:putative ABC transport system permease protein
MYFYNILSGYNAIEVLAKKNLKPQKNFIFKNSSLIIQLIVVFAMLTFSLFYYKQLDFMINAGKGFSTENLFLVNRINWDSAPFEEELANYPIVTGLSKGTLLPLHGTSTQYSIGLNDKPSETFSMELFRVDCDYISLYEINLKEGRDFSKEIIADIKGENILINESAAKLLGGKDLIGKETSQGKIIGIVEDFKFESFYKSLRPLFFRIPRIHPKYGNPMQKHGGLLIKYKEGEKENASRLINSLLARHNVNVLNDRRAYYKHIKKDESYVLFDTNHYDSLINDIYLKDIILQKAILLLTGIAILITMLGLIGMSLFKTQKRTKEIGIRKVNGATINEIMLMLNKDFIKWVVIAFVIACPIAYYAISKWLENFAYKTELSWWVFALAGVFTLVIALLTVSWQTYRAATRNPVESLRDE